MSPGAKMSMTERLRASAEMTGSDVMAAYFMRASVRLIFSSAFAGCLRASHVTDSGTNASTSGMNNAVTAAPK
jgi:hypothetical protein